MSNNNLDQDLVEEIEYMINALTKSGFFNTDEILEILEDEFIEENVDFSQFDISLNEFDNSNFDKLDYVFNSLADKNIVAIHNCGYDIEEGVADAFELYVHLNNNKHTPDGFCFYTFEDVEEAILYDNLKITFGDFENNEDKALDIGKIVYDSLKSQDFKINWDGTINNQIEINPFKWDKSYDSQKEYEMEGAYDNFVGKRC
ncbi:hypothetical protein [Methanobrevibacter sp.]|uniref:DUF6891 domain-containing protein n=1 Tax=Methanobrevibacter sp. TaxID=66852 RepID=UPI0026E06466|nr:hypothetical protein [Methanobrevibacter sp.]MDO5860989.1 hypothetical protein [Methanobrevibacter sp.]